MVVSSAPAGAGVGIMIWRSIQGFRFAPPLATFARPFGAKRSGIIILLAQGRQDTMWVRLRASALTFAHKSRKCDALPPGVREGGGVHQQALLRKNPPCVHGGLNGGLKPPEHSIAIGSRADQTLALLERPRSLLRKPPPAPAAQLWPSWTRPATFRAISRIASRAGLLGAPATIGWPRSRADCTRR